MQKTNRYLIALVAALGLIPIVLDGTIVTVAVTPIRLALHTDVNTTQWIFTGYLLANAARDAEPDRWQRRSSCAPIAGSRLDSG